MSHALSTLRDVDIDAIRRQFPALASETVFFENAGGSQVPAVVADHIRQYMLETYVQLGAGYAIADRCDAVVDDAHDFVSCMMNGTDTGAVILGPSSSQLIAMLAAAYARILEPGDEVIVTEAGHEANIGPWVRLAERGITVKTWPVEHDPVGCSLARLGDLLSERTRIVAVVHASNLLGEIMDVQAMAEMVHQAGSSGVGRARIVVDGVAYAPHRAIDVAAWDVDWYAYSTYKVYGPHMAALYGRHDALAELTGPNHFFIAADDVPHAFELGGVSHEGCAGLLALREYLLFLAGLGGAPAGGPFSRDTVVNAFDVMTAAERPLQDRLVRYLLDKPRVRIVGPPHAGPERVPTVSFIHETRPPPEIVRAAHARTIGIRHGHMYAHRLCEALGLEPEQGVVRVSLVHYNTVDEIDRLIDALEGVL